MLFWKLALLVRWRLRGEVVSKKEYARIEDIICKDQMRTVVRKICINDGANLLDLYAKLGWASGRWVWVDLTLSRYTGISNGCENKEVARLRRDLAEQGRRMLEVVCSHAVELLQSGERTLEDLVCRWKGTQFEPSGICDELKTETNTIGRVTSPLDAFAKVIEQEHEKWTEMMKKEVVENASK